METIIFLSSIVIEGTSTLFFFLITYLKNENQLKTTKNN